MPPAMHGDRGGHAIALPLLAGTLVTAIVAAAIVASPSPWMIAADTGSGAIGQTVPVYRTWLDGRVPEWTDLLWGGYPTIADCANAALYPPHLLTFLATRSAPLRFFDASFALHLGILVAGSAYLVAVLGAGRRAQAFAGVLAALCPFPHYCAVAFFPVFAAQAWWPWGLAAAERLARPTTPWIGGAMVLGWIALAAQVLTGMPEQAAYGALVASAWLLTRRAGLGLGARTSRLALLGAGALALAAPQLLPTAAYLPLTERATQMEHTLSGVAAIVPDDPARLFLPGAGVLHGIPSFIGLVLPALALAGVAARRPRAAFLCIVAAVALAYAMGSATPVYGWLHQVPPLDHFRSPMKLEALVELALVWSAAVGLDAALRARSAWARPIALALAVFAVAERAVYLPGELAAFGRLIEQTGIPPTLPERLAASRAVRGRRPSWPPSLVLDLNGPLGGDYARSVGALVGLASIRPHPVALLGRAHLAVFARRPNAELAALLGVRYLLVETPDCDNVARGSRWRLVETTDEFCLLENPRPSDRYTLVTQAKPMASEAEMVDAVINRPGGPIPIVAPPEALASLSPGYVWLAHEEPGHAALRVVTGKRGIVLVRQSALPGWDVRVDGTPVTPYPAAGIYFAVPVDAGVHQVTLEYRTPGFRLGVLVLVGWLLVTTSVAVARRWRRSPATIPAARAA
jgi:hypothetical protein